MIKGALVCATVYLGYNQYKTQSILNSNDTTRNKLICVCLKKDYKQEIVERDFYMSEMHTTPEQRANNVCAGVEYIFPSCKVEYDIVGDRQTEFEYDGYYTTTFTINKV